MATSNDCVYSRKVPMRAVVRFADHGAITWRDRSRGFSPDATVRVYLMREQERDQNVAERKGELARLATVLAQPGWLNINGKQNNA